LKIAAAKKDVGAECRHDNAAVRLGLECHRRWQHISRVFNRPQFSGRYDFQTKKFGCQCTKSGSHAVGLQEKSSKNLMQKQYLGPTTYASLMHQQHRSWFLRATAMVYSTSMARFSSVSQSFCRSSVTDVLWLNGAR